MKKATRAQVKALKYLVPQMKVMLVCERSSNAKFRRIVTPEDAAELLEPLRHYAEEVFVALLLNTRHEVIGVHEVSRGTATSSLVHPREVFKVAILANAYAMIVAHNHPSGSKLSPSTEDIETTKELIAAGKLLHINVVDSLILGPAPGGVYSIRESHPHIFGD